MSGLKFLFRRDRFTPLANSQWKGIEKILEMGRKRQHSLRRTGNAFLKINRLGMQWRNLEEKPYLYPAWQRVYYYFRKWQKEDVWGKILALLVEKERKRQGKQP